MSEPDRPRVFLVEDHPLMLFGIEASSAVKHVDLDSIWAHVGI